MKSYPVPHAPRGTPVHVFLPMACSNSWYPLCPILLDPLSMPPPYSVVATACPRYAPAHVLPPLSSHRHPPSYHIRHWHRPVILHPCHRHLSLSSGEMHNDLVSCNVPLMLISCLGMHSHDAFMSGPFLSASLLNAGTPRWHRYHSFVLSSPVSYQQPLLIRTLPSISIALYCW